MTNNTLTPDTKTTYGHKNEPMFMRLRTYVHQLTKQASRACEPIFRKEDASEKVRRWFGDGSEISWRSNGDLTEMSRRCHGDLRSRERGMLRYAVMMVVMIVVAVNTAWGQVGTDYSGKYYIAFGGKQTETAYSIDTPESNFYLCATEGWGYYYYHDGTEDITDVNNGQPFLTTYKCKLPSHNYDYANKAVWTIVRNNSKNLYYIKLGERYLVLNGKVSDGAQNRIRVHLEALTSADLETEEIDNKALFEITPNSNGGMKIRPKNTSGYWINVTNGNYDSLTGQKGKNDGPTGFKDVDGTIGIWNAENYEARCYLEDYITRPTITYNDVSDEITITAVQLGVNLIYTTDGSTPSTSNPNATIISGTEGNPTTVNFTPSDGKTTIKAVAVVGDELSNISTYTTPVFIGDNHKYLIQSVENTNFYMIQGDYTDPEIRINTSSLARPSMVWYFLNAGVTDGIQYYYMVNDMDGQYACFYKDASKKDVVCLKEASVFDYSDQFKFSIHPHASGGYFIKPLNYSANNGLNKGNGNNEASNVGVAGASNATARWNFLGRSAVTLPLVDTSFDVSTDNTYYYKIGNAGTTNPVYYIIPPTGTTGDARYAKTNSGEDDNMAWYFKQADSDEWLNYYYIVNGQTGKYLYYNGQIPTDEGFNPSTSLERVFTTEYISESGKVEDRYQYVVAKTTTDGQYYIVPKFLKYCSNTNYYMLWRDGIKTLRVNLQRKDASRKWTFNTTTFQCTAPEITYDNVNDQIEISSPQGAGVYYTIDGANNEVIPSSSTHYTVPIDDTGSTQTIRTVCARSADGSDNSDVVTVIFNPTITLSNASVTYDGNEHQPTISSVQNGATTIAASEYSATPIYIKDGVQVDYCKDAGEYTVVVTDAVGPAGANYFVYGATTFTINKADINPSVSIENWSYNDAASSPVVTGNLGEGTVTYEYKPQGAADTEYSTTVPETRGNYTIRATIAASTNYNGSNAATADFTITPKSLGSGTTPATGITIDAITKSGSDYSVPGINHNGTPLTLGTEGTAYDYSRTTDDSNPKYHVVTFTGANNYMGSVSAKFVNVNFYPNSANEEWAASFVINSSEGAFAMPTGYSAHIVTGASGNVVTAPALSYIPEDVPVILLSTASSNGFMAQPTSGEAPDVTDNKLRKAEKVAGTGEQEGQMVDPSFAAGEIYFLYNGEFVLNAAGTLAAGKVYLPKSAVSSGSAPSRLFINWGESTSINDTHLSPPTSHSSDVWYTLDGRRLNGKPTKKGLYLREGKKIVVR